MAHLDEYQVLSDRQHAFRKRHSCETQLTTVLNDFWVKSWTKEDRLTHLFWTEKAFDTPPHELLKSELFGYGIGGKTLRWIDSFLCYRTQRAVVNGETSEWVPVLSGVQQGTVFGPLLFSLYINDISTDIDSGIRLYADDCVCYREISDTDNSLKLQNDKDRFRCWARKWGMRFQPVKCSIMQITRKRTNKIEAYYTLEGTVLEIVDSIKYLGVTITWDGIHISAKKLRWIDSFLFYRTQRAVVNGETSEWVPVLSGVQQGTVFGPLLFFLYINDISTDIDSEIRLYADDCVCYRESVTQTTHWNFRMI